MVPPSAPRGRTGALLHASGVDPSQLHVEGLETHLLDDVTVAVLQTLKGMGVKVTIDDFGGGYAGLVHLKRLPADTVKIDGRLVANLGEHPDEPGLHKLVAVTHGLGMTVIADDIDRRDQADALRAAGCDLAQGSLWRSASSPGDLPTSVRSHAGTR